MKKLFTIVLLAITSVVAMAQTTINAARVNKTRYADQFVAATVTLRITAACNDLAGANGVVVIPSTMGAGAIPTLPAGCIVEDQRGNTGNGGILWSRKLSGTEQYGFQFAVQNLASDGQSATAILGATPPGVSGTNVVGVRGQVYSPGSAGGFFINLGDGVSGGPGAQGDSANLPDAVGLLGTTAVSGSTLLLPSIGVKALATGHPTYNAAIALTATNDNGNAAVFNLNAPAGAAIDNQVAKIICALNLGCALSIENTGNTRWDLISTGPTTPCTGAARFFVIYNQTDNRCPFNIDRATPNSTLTLNATGIKINGGTTLATSNQSGTGSIAMTNSPVFVTPTVGVATGTSLALGGGTALTTTNRSGTGNLCMTVSCAMTTPNIGVATATTIAIGGGSNINKYQQLTAAITPAAVAANTCAEQTFTVTGLATSDVVSVNGRSALTAMAFPVNYRPSAVDTLSVTYCNPTAAPVTPTANTILLTAIR